MAFEGVDLRKRTPAQIIAYVNGTGLAAISKMSADDLKALGWTENSIVDRLYDLNSSTGLWRPRSYSGTYGPDEMMQINTYELSTRLTDARLDHLDADLNDLLTQQTYVAGCFADVWDTVNHKLKVVV